MIRGGIEKQVGTNLLRQSPLDLIPLDHLLLGQHLHRKQLVRLLLPHEVHLANVSLAQKLDFVEAIRTNLDAPDADRGRRVRSSEGSTRWVARDGDWESWRELELGRGEGGEEFGRDGG